METVEAWKNIAGYEALYQVSSLGRVKSLRRRTFDGRWVSERILRGSSTRSYKVVRLCKNCVGKTVTVHRLVAAAFIPNPENKPQINHLNGNKLENFIGNLEWSTASENQFHAIANGLKAPFRGSSVWNAKVTEIDVLQIRKRLTDGERPIDIAREYKVDAQLILDIKRRKSWKHI